MSSTSFAGGFLGACLLLLALTRLNESVLPLAWPDEALFSAPAAALASGENFATPVLAGLIPGMERATLWNSPLFMVLLSGPYALSGESQAIGRAFSFALALLALAIFALLSGRVLGGFSRGEGADDPLRTRVAAALPLILTCDLSFQRAANTIRMDMLTLCFMLGSFYCLVRDRKTSEKGNGHRVWSLAAGVCVGGAALSHPIAVLLVPLVIIWTLPRWRSLLLTVAGTIAVFSLWLPYIFTHLQLFCVQFIAQLVRKKDILSLVGGDTGGVLRVYTAQYGGQGFWMVLAALMVFLALLAGLWRLLREWRQSGVAGSRIFPERFLNLLGGDAVRLIASFVSVFALVLLSSEAWYPLYVGPFLLLTTARLYCDHAALHFDSDSAFGLPLPRWLQPESLALPFAAFALSAGSASFMVREHIVYDTPAQVERFEAAALTATRDCRAVYLRVRPDPYFALRARSNGRQEILEFIPGKLQFDPREMPFGCLRDCMKIPGGHDAMLRRRYDTIDCFLLDPNDAWEPPLRDYLRRNAASFQTEELPHLPPLDPARLVRRIHSGTRISSDRPIKAE